MNLYNVILTSPATVQNSEKCNIRWLAGFSRVVATARRYLRAEIRDTADEPITLYYPCDTYKEKPKRLNPKQPDAGITG
jgi:hypothetical protein